MSQEFHERLERVREKIQAACKASGRLESHVTLVAAGKTKPWEDLKTFAKLGVRNFGENYVQEAREKQAAATKAGFGNLSWHLIGTLQSNKAKLVPGNFSLFHALDSLSLAQKLDIAAARVNVVQECLLEVNVDLEESKGALAADAIARLLENANSLKNLTISGLMCIPAPGNTRQAFARLREILEHLNEQSAYRDQLRKLSMGMSADFEAAILGSHPCTLGHNSLRRKDEEVICLKDSREGTLLTVHAQPGASRSAIRGLHGDALKISIQAPPVDGAANEAIQDLLAEVFGLSRSRIELKAGASGRRKVFLLVGIPIALATRTLEGKSQ